MKNNSFYRNSDRLHKNTFINFHFVNIYILNVSGCFVFQLLCRRECTCIRLYICHGMSEVVVFLFLLLLLLSFFVVLNYFGKSHLSTERNVYTLYVACAYIICSLIHQFTKAFSYKTQATFDARLHNPFFPRSGLLLMTTKTM